jgi:hypothetical protein
MTLRDADSTGDRVALLVLLAGATVAVAVSRHRDSGPPGLSAHLVNVLNEYQDRHIVVDETATEEHEDQARLLATRFGPTEAAPDRRVVGVSLAQYQGRVVWVVASEGVDARCFGHVTSCGGSDGKVTSINVLYSESLRDWQSFSIDE